MGDCILFRQVLVVVDLVMIKDLANIGQVYIFHDTLELVERWLSMSGEAPNECHSNEVSWRRTRPMGYLPSTSLTRGVCLCLEKKVWGYGQPSSFLSCRVHVVSRPDLMP